MSSPGNTPPFEPLSDFLDDYPDVDQHSCQLLGPTALVVQGLMGLLVILSLVYKRHREKPKRLWRIWLFDVSKQIVGQMFVHGVNLLISDLVSHHSSSNACVSYFLNILLDTTLGVALLYVILRFFAYILIEKLNLKGYESGKYGSPPSLLWWARQAAVYVLSLSTMKLLVFLLMTILPGLFDIGEWLLGWTWTGEGDALQVIFTMGIFPIIMNILQFWLIDSIVKASAAVALPPDSRRSSFDEQERESLFVASDSEDDSGGRPRFDIENPRSLSRSSSRSHLNDNTKIHLSVSDENKSAGSSSSGLGIESRDSVAMHAYPPSIASTSTLRSSTPPTGGSPKRNRRAFKRRSPPPPLRLGSPVLPAIGPSHVASMLQPTRSRDDGEKKVVPDESNKKWTESWGDADDWANRVGEEEWTGRRMEQTRDALNATVVHAAA